MERAEFVQTMAEIIHTKPDANDEHPELRADTMADPEAVTRFLIDDYYAARLATAGLKDGTVHRVRTLWECIPVQYRIQALREFIAHWSHQWGDFGTS